MMRNHYRFTAASTEALTMKRANLYAIVVVLSVLLLFCLFAILANA